MTAEEFRRAALALPGAIESAHMAHPDFRVAGRIFATLGSPDQECGMVKLPPEESRRLIEAQPEVFTPAAGAWGRQGCTLVRLAGARIPLLSHALEQAWQTAQQATRSKHGVSQKTNEPGVRAKAGKARRSVPG